MSWVSVGDNLPPLDEIVWLRTEDDVILGVRALVSSVDAWEWLWGRASETPYLNINTGKIDCDCEFDDIEPSHWHPLPQITTI